MCGILFYFQNENGTTFTNNFKELLLKLEPRGPENWNINELNNHKFGFTRLSINGLTNNGMQPFNENDNYISICNGELYNYKELAKKYDIELTTGSDCEILIPLYKKIGIKKLCQELDGVFAFVLYDKINDKVYAARDPYGVRPLFIGFTEYVYNNSNIMISSEIKSLVDDCVYIEQFNPGNYFDFSTISYKQYFIKPEIIIKKNYEDICLTVKDKLIDAVNKRMLSDVEIGCLLSGGIDSSLICALVAKNYSNPKQLKTFSIGLENSPDLKYAKEVAEFLGTNHFEVVITEEDVLESINEVIYALESYDITTVRASIGNYLIGKYIKKNTYCKVIFNGDGADEIFGSYRWLSKITDTDEFFIENNKLLNEIQYFDVLRSDRSMAGNGLEARTPFLDKELVKFVMTINNKYKMHHSEIEKKILRDAFKNDNILPDSVLWRSKTAFSDGVTSNTRNIFDIIQEYIDTQITDNEYWLYQKKYKCISKEHYYYIKIFKQYFKDNLNVIPHLWMPPDKYLGDKIDPSARLL